MSKSTCTLFLEYFMTSNPLHIDLFTSTTQMEAELISWTLEFVHGEKPCCGVSTSGASESLVLTVLTYREWAKKAKGITKPNIVVPESSHVGVFKGAEFFNVEVRMVPCGPNSRIIAGDYRKFINDDTIAIYSSAPSHGHGFIDPISELGLIA